MLDALIRGEIGQRLGFQGIKDKYNSNACKATNADMEVMQSAILNGDIELVRQYLDKFGNSIINRQIEDDAHIDSMFGYRRGRGDTLLIMAAHYGKADIIALLLERGAKVDKQNNRGETALMRAVWEAGIGHRSYGSIDVGIVGDRNEAISFLLSYNADMHKKGKDGYNPVMVAEKYHDKDVLPLFKKEAARRTAAQSSCSDFNL